MKKLAILALCLNFAVLLLIWRELSVAANAQGVPTPAGNGDVNGDGSWDISDASYLLNWLFLGGPEPIALAGGTDLDMRVADLEDAVAALQTSQPSVEAVAAELAANHADALRGDQGPPGKPGVGGDDPVGTAVESLALLLGDPELPSRVPTTAMQQTSRLTFDLEIAGSAFEGTVVGLHIVEAVSSLPVAHLAISSSDRGIMIDEVLTADAHLSWVLNGQRHQFAGEVVAAGVGASNSQEVTYRLSIAPRLRRLQTQHRSGLSSNQKYSDVVERLLGGSGLQAAQLEASDMTREAVVQYRETDFNFVSRLLEEEGVFYYFMYADGRDNLHITGDMSSLPQPPEAYPYRGHEAPPDELGEEYVETLHVATVSVPRTVQVRQWDYRRKETITATQATGSEEGLQDDFVGERVSPEEATLEAQIRAELLELGMETYTGTSTIGALRPGRIVSIEGTRGVFSGQYFVSSVTHTFATVGSGRAASIHYGNSFQCSPSDVQFRPQRVTPKPQVSGLQTALVVGEVDEFGRIKVKFPWFDDGSLRIRMAQLGAGKERGFQWIPEVEDEVVVQFYHGDINHPIIIGALWNGVDVPPEPLPDNKDRRVIKSRSGHVLVFDDKDGEELVEMSSVRDMSIGSDGIMEVSSTDDFTVASDRDVLLSSGRGMEVQSSTDLDIAAGARFKVTSGLAEISSGLLSLNVAATTVDGVLASTRDGGPRAAIAPGQRLRDNSIVAWARVTGTGDTGDAKFGVDTVSRTRRGLYRITLSSAASSAEELIPVAVAQVPSQPTSAATVKIVSVNQVDKATFEVYVNNGALTAADGDFTFMVTAR